MPILRGDVVEKRPAVPAEMTGLYTAEALKFIEANCERPFFLYLAHAMPHLPFDASPKFKGKSQRGLYGDVVEELDDSTGQILDKLRMLGLAEKHARHASPATTAPNAIRPARRPVARHEAHRPRRRPARAVHRVVAGQGARGAGV